MFITSFLIKIVMSSRMMTSSKIVLTGQIIDNIN